MNASTETDTQDENLWLEDIYGDKPLAWVDQQNARTMEMLHGTDFESSVDRVLEVMDSTDRIPMVSKHGEWFYNFWKDANHPKGIWRRTTLEQYRTDDPKWELVLDIDALAATEGTEWV